MDLLSLFKNYLFSQEDKPTKVTVKNYLSDVNHFVRWYESTFAKTFAPKEVSGLTLSDYRASCGQVFSSSSLDRHFSSLRKFFKFLLLEGVISLDPFSLKKLNLEAAKDPLHLKDFKDYLYVYNSSRLTIKNYLIDIKQFLAWTAAVTASTNVLAEINSKLVEEYKQRLVEQGTFSPATINRKLSSLRKYLAWASDKGLIENTAIATGNLATAQTEQLVNDAVEQPIVAQPQARLEQPAVKSYSAFPPFRVAQKVSEVIIFALDNSLILHLVKLVDSLEYALWKGKGQPVFKQVSGISYKVSSTKKTLNTKYNLLNTMKILNIPKSSYAPLEISTKYLPWYKKAWITARYSRPKWYKTYRSYPIAQYLNFAVLIIFLMVIGFGFYNTFFQKESPTLAVAGTPVAPPRILSFQGRLTDQFDTPISTPSALRFAIYDAQTPASSAADLLWQEEDQVSPDQDGIFNILLGNTLAACGNALIPATGACQIPQALFATESALFLGVTVGNTPELTPRQQLATVAYATNAETLQGMVPTTSGPSAYTNTVLALDGTTTSPTLTIGGAVGATFKATGGQFQILGTPLLLGTTLNSGGNVAIVPDGLGFIDIQRPIINSTNNGNLIGGLGAVEVDDRFAVLATSSGAGVILNQNGAGDIFTASAGGVPKFTITYNGGIALGGSVSDTSHCIIGGATAAWGACGSGGANYWNLVSGTGGGYITPINSTADLLIGGQSTASASFAVLGLATNSISGVGGHQTTASVSGNFVIMPNNGFGGLVGIGTTSPTYSLDVAGTSNSWNLLSNNLLIGTSSASLATAFKGFNGYTDFSGGIGTGGVDSILNAQRLTSAGNLVNIGSYQGGEMLLTKAGTFTTKADYTTGAGPDSTAIGDLNGDGKADVVTANTGGTISVLMNNGDGTFPATGTNYTAGSNPIKVAIGDLNGDGKADLAVTNLSSNTVSIFINKGDGTFYPKVDYATGSHPREVAIGDLNGDGKADLAVTNQSDTTVSIFINKGDGTFYPKVDYATGTLPYGVAIGDLNGDGKADLAVANQTDNTVSVLINKGNGTFPTAATYTTGSSPYEVVIGDLNGDGKADMAVDNSNDANVSVFLNNGNGTFPATGTTYSTGAASAPRALAIGDLNGDGKADLATANYNASNVSVLMNNGAGTFATHVDYAAGTLPYGVAIGDLNGDGKADMAVANYNAGTGTTVSVFLNQVTPMFYAQSSTGNVGIGTAGPLATLDVRGNSGTLAVASVSGTTSFAALVANNNGVGDLFTASASGWTRFRIDNTGALTSAAYTNAGGVLYTSTTGLIGQTGIGTSGQCLTGGTTPTWNSCAAAANNFWQRNAGALSPLYGSDDLLLGSNSTTSAKIAFTGMMGNNPQASFSGNLIVMPWTNGTNENGGNVGIGTTSPLATLSVAGTAMFQSPVASAAAFEIMNTSGAPVFLVDTTNSTNLLTNPGFETGLSGWSLRNTSTLTWNKNKNFLYHGQASLKIATSTSANSGASTNAFVGGAPGINTYTLSFYAMIQSGSLTTLNAGYNQGSGDVNCGLNNNIVKTNGFQRYSCTFTTTNTLSSVFIDQGTGTTALNLYIDAVQLQANTSATPYQIGSIQLRGVINSPVAIQPLSDSTTVFQVQNAAGTDNLFIADSLDNAIGIGTNSPLATLDVRGLSGTTAVASVSGNTTYAALVANNNGVGDLITASASGWTRFSVRQNGTLTSAAYTNVGGVLYTSSIAGGVGVLGQTGVGTSAQCLIGGAAPSWSSCASAASNFWQRNAGALSPLTSSDDLLIGNSSTASAIFAFTGLMGNKTQASFSGQLIVMPNNGYSGRVGIGTTTPAYALDVAGVGNFYDVSTNELLIATSSASQILAYKGFNGYTNFSGGIGTGGIDSILNAQRITSTGNLTNIGSYQGGEVLLTSGGTFGAPTTYTAGTTPYSMAVGDLNGDGKADMVVANSGSSNISVLMNNGNGTFAPAVNYTVGTNPETAAIGDLNGDGKADIVVGNNGNYISVLMNNGNGTFGAAVNYTIGTGANPYGVAIGDLNGDGKADIAVVAFGTGGVYVLLNNGNGTFAPAVSYPNGGGLPYRVAIGDLNGDGKADIVTSSPGATAHNISVLMNNGNGTFAPAVTYTAGTNIHGVAIGDLNGDGKADIVATSYGTNAVAVFINNGNGTFPATGTAYTVGTAPDMVAVGDVNGDGKADIVTANDNGASTTVSVLMNYTTNPIGLNFAPVINYSLISNANGVAIGDLNGDGKNDLAVAYNGGAAVLLNQTSPILYAQALTGTVGIGLSSTPTAMLDVRGIGLAGGTMSVGSFSGQTSFAALVANNNGVGDLFTASASGWTRFTVKNTGQLVDNYYTANGCTLKSDSLGNITCGTDNTGAAAGYNFWTELAGATSLINTSSDLLIGGSSTASADFAFTGMYSPLHQTIASFSGQFIVMPNNGYSGRVGIGTTTPAYNLDVAGTANSWNLLSNNLLLGTSSASLATAFKGFNGYTNFSGGIGTGGIDSIPNAQRITSTGNLTNIGSYQGGEMLLTKSGTFAPAANYTTGTGPQSVAIGDVNGDGKADMVVGYGSGTTVSVFINNGSGTFADPTSYTVGNSPESVAIGDLNGDGKADIVTANYGSSNVSVLINNGSGGFAPAVNYTTATAPQSVAVGDVNGDGKADIVTANDNGSGTVSVLINNGSGSFAPAASYAVGGYPISVAIGDLNGDGKADVVTANSNDNTVSVLINNGNGTFATQATYPTGTSPYSVAIGDLNGDGKADLAVANFGSSSVSVLINNGSGGFAPAVNYNLGSNAWGIAIGDLNGDGKADIAVGNNNSSSISVLINNGSGIFTTPVSYTVGTQPQSVAIGDLNGDGKADIIAANYNSNNVSVLLNQTSPILYAQALTGRVGIGLSSTPTAMLDVRGIGLNGGTLSVGSFSGQTSFAALVANNNGVGDLFTASASGWTKFRIDNSGNLLPGTNLTQNIGSPTLQWNNIYAGNVFAVSNSTIQGFWQRNSGALSPTNISDDLLIGGSSTASATIRLASNGIISSYGEVSNSILLGTSSASLATAFKGFNGYTNFSGGIGTGGVDSILNAQRLTSQGNLTNIGSYQGGEMLLTKAGTFPTNGTNYSVGNYPSGVATADFNGDGKPDIAVVNGNDGTVSVLLNNGNGTGFTSAPGSPFSGGASFLYALAVGDLDGDGKPDMVATNSTGGISVLINNGWGGFAPAVQYSAGTGHVAIGDLNGDGKPDIAVINSTGTVSVLMNNGNGTFAPKVNYNVGANPSGVAIGDLNGDGKADIVATNGNDNTFSILMNNGNGTFASQITISSGGTTPRNVAIGDLNGDGEPDLAVANSGGTANIAIYINNGGGFPSSPTTTLSGVSSPYAIALGDINGDGKPDIAVANSVISNNITIFMNNGNGTFASSVSYTAGNSPSSIVISDLNGDGKADIVAANSSSNNVSVFLNQTTPIFYAQASTGYVGIGTTDTTKGKLELVQTTDSNAGGIAILNSTLGGSDRLWIDASNNLRLDAGVNATSNILLNGAGTGNVGIGTTGPNATLDIEQASNAQNQLFVGVGASSSGAIRFQATASSVSTAAGQFWNAFPNTGNGGNCTAAACHTALSLKLGTNNGSTNTGLPGTADRFVNFSSGNGFIMGKITGNGTGSIALAATGGDYAEWFKKANPGETINPGDLVCENSSGQVTRCDNNNSKLIGVASDSYFLLGNDNNYADNPDYIVVGLLGQIKTSVNSENGAVQPGDLLTYSSTPGQAAKAIRAGYVIGRAIDGGTSGRINVYINPTWYDPQVQLTDTGNLNVTDQTVSDTNYTIPHYYTLNDTLGNPLQRVGEFSDAAIANLKVGLVNAQQITTNALSVATDNVTIGGQSLKSYIASVVSDVMLNTKYLIPNTDIVSPIASVDEIHTNFISPVDTTAAIGLKLDNNKLSILNTNNSSGSAVATIDNLGNATFSGSLTANNLTIQQLNNTGDATIGGTLHAGKILASDIVGLASNSATYVTNNIMNVYNSTPSTTSSNFGLITNAATPNTNYNIQDTGTYADISSYSGQLAYVDNLAAGNAAFSQNLTVFGQTSLSDTSVIGQLSVSGSLILADNSINVLGSDLNLQPLRQGGLSIMGGLVYIDTDGNLKVGGNAEFAKNVTVKGTLSTNIISPLPGNDLSLNTGHSNLIVTNASNAAVLSVNPLGDLVASGAGTFAKLNLNLVQPALAVSPTEFTASGSAGTANVGNYQTQVTIDDPLVTAKSLIYITPTSNTNNQVLYLQKQVPGQSFTVGLQNPSATAIPFNWIIVN